MQGFLERRKKTGFYVVKNTGHIAQPFDGWMRSRMSPRSTVQALVGSGSGLELAVLPLHSCPPKSPLVRIGNNRSELNIQNKPLADLTLTQIGSKRKNPESFPEDGVKGALHVAQSTLCHGLFGLSVLHGNPGYWFGLLRVRHVNK